MKHAIRSLALLVALLLVSWAAMPVSATHVEPEFVEGNPTCTGLGYAFGFKPQPEPPPSGTYSFPGDAFNSVTITSDGASFDWTSTLGIDAVIVKGGPNANRYVYDPPAESFGDTDLHSPINPNNNQPFGISHIEFCYEYEVTVSKTAQTSFIRTFNWTIAKAVTPATWELFTGDSGTSQYTIEVTKDQGTDSDWAVEGTILIENETPLAATITGVTDDITGIGSVTVDCGVSFPYTLASGDTLECTYSAALPDGTARTNTATVTTSGAVGGGTATAGIVFGDPTTIVNDEVTVEDTNGESWNFSDSGSQSYERIFTCDDDEGDHGNTATIVETGQSDSASVTVNCYTLAVTKDAATSFKRTYDWTIDKAADQTALTLATGQQFLVNYTVQVNATYVDSDWQATGQIDVHNPAPIDATLNAVSDIVSGVGMATVNCGVSFPYTLVAGDTLPCTYSVDLPDDVNRTNTATATLQNYASDHESNATPSGTTDFSGTANVDFNNATIEEVDKCIDVTDTYAGFLGTVCYGVDTLPKTFTYSRSIGAFDVCGNYTVENTVSFTTDDTGTTGSDNWTVNINVPCADGCTLTPGYWKTHSHHGPAPEDDAWFSLGDVDGDGISEGADETFFLSGQTYYQVLWTPPSGGNAYYILAHAYLAAKLNILNGASSTTPVDAAITFAENFFTTKTPSSNLTMAERNQAIRNAATLDQYNNGMIGPGHCSEQARANTSSTLQANGRTVYLPLIQADNQ